jgi:DNA-binding MarR family transcriptional regulator
LDFDANSLEWLFRVLNRMHLYYIDKEMEKRNLGFAGFPPILFVLSHEMKGKPASQKELADFLGIRPSSVAIAVKRMEQAGLVERVADENDLRRNIVTITKPGEKLVRDSMKVFDEADRKMYDGFSEEEKEQLKQFFTRIIQNLENLGVHSPAGFKKE